MNALIIGGSGGLSRVLAKKALEIYKVWTVTRGVRPVPEGVVSLKADRGDVKALKQVLEEQKTRWDVVFDCICMDKEGAEADIEILSEFTDRLVVISTDSVYDGRFKATPENEQGICVIENGSSSECTYAGNKRHMEEVFLEEMASENPRLNITIFRPGHIYGPGFVLGCFPEHSRQKELPALIKSGEPIRLVGMGTYIIHPIYVDDLAQVMIDCAQNEKTFNEIFCVGGPEAIENRIYYECIAEILGVELKVKEVPLDGYLEKHPEYSGHLCHRIYDLSKLRDTGVKLPSTSLRVGMKKSLQSLGEI